MHRVRLVEISGTTFVKEGRHTLPAFDGEPKFDVKLALLAIGGISVQGDDWNVPIMLHELAFYLSTLQASGEDQATVRSRWARQYAVQRLTPEIPFDGRDIDWEAFREKVDADVRARFPLCV